MPQNPQNTMSQTALKSYNQFISASNEALRWLKITTDTKMKLKVETTFKEMDQQLLDFITIDILKIEHQHPSCQHIITLHMTPITNTSFNKHLMPQKLIRCHLLHHSNSTMKAMFCNQTLNILPNYCSKKLKNVPCTICYTEKIKLSPKGSTVDTSKLQPGELIHMYFVL